MIYVFDTNSLSELDAYYPDIFRTFWTQFDAAADAGDVISTREVKTELDLSGKAVVTAWARRRSTIFTRPT